MAAVDYSVSNGVATLTLNNEVINEDVAQGLAAGWSKAIDDKAVRAIVVVSSGSDFTKGPDGSGSHAAAFPATHQILKPVIVAVNGACHGAGLRLVGQADIAIASDDAVFAGAPLTEDDVPYEDLAYARRKLPLPMAELLIMAGGHWTIDANRALETGWVSEVVTRDQLATRAQGIGEAIAKNDPVAVELAKEILVAGRDTFTRDSIEQARVLVPTLHENRAARERILARVK